LISDALLRKLGCPTCLEAAGCERCGRAAAGPDDYALRAGCACGGPDKVALHADGEDGLRCPACAARYPLDRTGGHVDVSPRSAVGAVTQYADHEFHERLGVVDAPPVLSARVKADMMRGLLDLKPGDSVLDLGSGAGKFALYASDCGATATGVDIAPFFLPRAAATLDLVIGDLRRLPFRKGSFPKAYTLDVLEHLDEPGVCEVLLEARRVLTPRGALFVYTHAMESSKLASFQRAVNRLAKRLGRAGLIDHEREAMRKSDHVNAIASHEHFEALCAGAGLRVADRRYYNVVFKAVIEDLLLRMIEQRRRARSAAPSAPAHDHAGESAAGAPDAHDAHDHAPRKPPSRFELSVAMALTWLLKLDVVLFGGIRTGPFFARLEGLGSPAAGERK
jgi:ubiquinone/menaquinone biosynthesis C-methylase UbiE